MLDWIFEGIVTWVASVVSSLFDMVSGLFLIALGTDMTAMEEYFPFVSKAFTVMQYTAWSMLFLITVWQLFKAFGGPVSEAENPWTLLARSSLFALLIGYAKPILQMTLNIARAPYTSLMDLSMSGEDFTFTGVELVLSNGIMSITAMVSVVGTLLLIILLISLGWNYIKLLLETVERYIVVGVLFYTSPLAFCMGGSKATNPVFKSWCRMVGSQLLLLVMNVWFLRGFSSSMGQYIATGGTLTNGQGSMFLWVFCALAFLKTAQKFDSYLAAMGLNVAQTGSSMGMEMLMAVRMIGGIGSGARTAGNVFGGTMAGTGGVGAGAVSQSFATGFANRFKGNSFVRDAVVEGGTRMGAGGSVGFVGRTFGGIAARNGTVLTGDSISSVAARLPNASGSIAGNIADRSLENYMPLMKGYQLSETQISGGQITTKAVGEDGKEAEVSMYSMSQHEKPDVPHSIVTASDGSQWYQMASGKGAGVFYDVPEFHGTMEERELVAATFPDAGNDTMLRTVEPGVLEATTSDGSSLWYNSAYFNEPEAPHSVMQSSNGVEWYAMDQAGVVPAFGTGYSDFSDAQEQLQSMYAEGDSVQYQSMYAEGDSAQYQSMYAEEGSVPYQNIAADGGQNPIQSSGAEDIQTRFESSTIGMVQSEFNRFMPGYEKQIVSVNTEHGADGSFEVRHKDGSGTMFYDTARYASPRGEYQMYEDAGGHRWYAVYGESAVDRKPVYEDGKPKYNEKGLQTISVETVRYKNTPSRFGEVKSRKMETKTPRRKR